jgi:ABC transporter ATM
MISLRVARTCRFSGTALRQRWYYSRPAAPSVATNTSTTSNEKDRETSELFMVRHLFAHVWPRQDVATRARVVTALGLLLGGKLLNVQVPILFKDIVDTLNQTDLSTASTALSSTTFLTATGALFIGYGGARFGATLFQELRNVVFARVAQSTIRKIARETFAHLLTLDLSWHLSRQTGGLSRAVDRGTKFVSDSGSISG